MKTFRLVISGAVLVFSSLHLAAAELYWDADGTAAGDVPASGAGLGGSGNWDQISALWFNGFGDIAWTNANNDDAIFSGTAGTVILTENISAGNLSFTNVTGNYVITNATGVEVLTIAGAIDTGGGEHTIGAPIADTNILNKNGAGRLHLPVNNGPTLTGNVMINQGDISVENSFGAGQNNSITVADGAALVLNGGAAGLNAFAPSVTINGFGITNSGAIRNLSGVTTFYGQIILGETNNMIYVDSGAALAYSGSPLTDKGNNYSLTISGSGTGNVHLGETSIGGTLFIEGSVSVYSYLTSVSPTDWKSTYVGPGSTLYVEYFNGYGTQPATLMTTNVILDGGAISSSGNYTNYATGGITATTNGGALTNTDTTGVWDTCNIYSSNAPVTFTGAGSFRPGGAPGTNTGTINLGTGSLIKGGGGDCNLGYANPSLEIYSNLVVNGGSLTFNYDVTVGQLSSLGTAPTTLNSSNIILNGGSLHVGHTTTIAATRGIYVTSSGGTIEDVTSSGTVTIASPITGPGNMNYPLGKSGSTTAVTLTANNSYAVTTVSASCTVNVGSGGSTGTLGTGNTTDNGTLTFNRTGAYSYGGVIGGSGVVNKTGSGAVTFTGANTYSGNTTISGGALLIDNTSGSGTGTNSVAVNSGGTLGGTGTISGQVTVASGGALALGLTTLTINNNLSLAGNVSVSVNKSVTPSNGMAVVSGTLTRTGTGTVTVTNLGPALAPGDTFQLFSQAVSGAGTMTITSSGPNLVWVNHLAVNGTISVALPTPQITQAQNSGGNIVFSGTNGFGNGTYYVLTSTNLALPLNQWTTISTNSFLSNGQFSVTNAITPGNSQQFYTLLQVP